jgi:hypothetical protein
MNHHQSTHKPDPHECFAAARQMLWVGGMMHAKWKSVVGDAPPPSEIKKP